MRAENVSIIVPLRNEEQRVEALVESIAAQDFPGELDVTVADGASSDRSVERLEAAARRLGVRVTVVENSDRLIPHGLNRCLRSASGDFVIRMDCRGAYPRDYVRRCLAAAEATGAWNVGGVIAPCGRTRAERAVACAMDGPFGGIGWTRHAGIGGPVETDTVYCGAFPRPVLDGIGRFDESLPFNEDEDLNLRLRRAGGRVVVDPRIRIHYTPRGSARELFGQNYRIGRGKVDVMGKHRTVLSARSLAPGAFVGSVGILGPAALRWRRARRVLAGEAALYVAAATGFGARSLRRHREPWALLPRVVGALWTIHVAYGAGMLHGALTRAAWRRRNAS